VEIFVSSIDTRLSSVWAGIAQSVWRFAVGWTVRDRIPVGERFSAPSQTGSGARTSSHTMGTGSFLGVKRREYDVDHPPHLAQMLKKEYGYTTTPPFGPSRSVRRWNLPFRRNNIFLSETRELYIYSFLYFSFLLYSQIFQVGRGQLKCDGTRAEIRFRLSCETDESI